MTRYPFAVALGATALVASAGCGSGSDAVCLSSETGEVCADGGDGRVEFGGSGLEPGSEVRLVSDEVNPIVGEITVATRTG